MEKIVNKWIDLGNGIIVNFYSDMYLPNGEYEVWEVTDEPGYQGYSTFTDHNGFRLGKYVTKELTPELDALPAWSDERSTAVQAFFARLEKEAQAYIQQATRIAKEGKN